MDKSELIADLEAIFEDELNILKTEETFRPTLGRDLQYQHLDYLIRLYLTIEREAELKETLISFVFTKLHQIKENFRDRIRIPYSDIRLCFLFLIQINNVENAIRCLSIRQEKKKSFYSIVNFIPALFKYYNVSLSTLQLKALKDLISNHPEDPSISFNKKNALDILHYERFKIVKGKIDCQNIEINRDKQEIINRISKIGINDNINKFFNDLEDYIISGTPHEYAGKIAVFRNVMCDFFVDLAKKISVVAREQIPDYSHINKSMQEIGKSRYFIKDKLELTDNENKFINDFVSILQDEGGHSFGTEKEYLRLSKNIAIEIILFLLTKYEEKFG